MMNKRQRKKFKKKNRCRTYYGYRQAEIFRRVSNYIDLKSNDIVYIVDSRRMDLKHFQKVSVLKNCYPIGTGSDNGDKLEHDSTTLEFTCTKYQNTDIDRVAELLKSVMNSHSTDLTDIVDTDTCDTYMTPSTTLLASKLTEATEIIQDIPDDRILKYLNDGFNSSKDNIE